MRTIGVNVAVLRHGEVLLTKRDDFHVWCMPGGHLDTGETFPEAARREVREETGLDVALSRFVGVYSRPLWGDYHILVFASESTGGAQRAQAGEVLDMDFFGAYELPEDLLLGQRRRLLDAFNGCHGVCRREAYPLPRSYPAERQELYRMRDDSGLSRLECYRQYIAPVEAHGTVLDLGM